MTNLNNIYNDNINKMLTVVGTSTLLSNLEKNQICEVLIYFNYQYAVKKGKKIKTVEDNIRAKSAEDLYKNFVGQSYDQDLYYSFTDPKGFTIAIFESGESGELVYSAKDPQTAIEVLQSTTITIKKLGFGWNRKRKKFIKKRTLQDIDFDTMCRMLQNSFDQDIQLNGDKLKYD